MLCKGSYVWLIETDRSHEYTKHISIESVTEILFVLVFM